jgi:hypothetical protein
MSSARETIDFGGELLPFQMIKFARGERGRGGSRGFGRIDGCPFSLLIVRLDDSRPDCVMHQFDYGMKIQLPHDSGSMRFHGSD